ncbi:DNA-3-methyladenine glycosylase [compost metagenome]
MTIIRGDEDIRTGLLALFELDPSLKIIAGRCGPVPLRLSEPGFAGLASIVVSQMVSRASADAIWGRIVKGTEVVTAERYLAVHPDIAGGFGLSRAKAQTLLRIATAVAEGGLDLEALGRMDATAAMAELTAVKGVGPWTAQVYLMFCGGHADIFPVGDVALQAAVAHALDMEVRPTASHLAGLAEKWSPWRSVAARLFWAYYAEITRREVAPIA